MEKNEANSILSNPVWVSKSHINNMNLKKEFRKRITLFVISTESSTDFEESFKIFLISTGSQKLHAS